VLFALEQRLVLPESIVTRLKTEALEFREKPGELAFPFHGESRYAGYWGSARLAPDDEGDWRLQLYVWPEDGKPAPVPQNSLKMEALASVLSTAISTSDAHPKGVVDGIFSLPDSQWRPAVTLPVRLAGVLDDAEGAPTITGFEFSFQDESSELRYASISTFAGIGTINIRLMLRLAPFPIESILERACEALGSSIALLAQPVRSAEAIDHG
jgi:hypothetical protein